MNSLLAELTAVMPLVNGAIYSLYLAQTMQKITQIGHIVPNAVFIAVGREKVLKQLYYNPSVSLQSMEVPRVEDFKQNITFEQKKDSLESVRGNVEPEKSFQSFQNVNVNSQDKKAEKRRSSIDPSMLIEAKKRVSIDTSIQTTQNYLKQLQVDTRLK